MKELVKLKLRQKETVWLIVLLKNTSFDQENENVSDEIGIKDKIDENKLKYYIHKNDISYQEGYDDNKLKLDEESKYNKECSIIDADYF